MGLIQLFSLEMESDVWSSLGVFQQHRVWCANDTLFCQKQQANEQQLCTTCSRGTKCLLRLVGPHVVEVFTRGRGKKPWFSVAQSAARHTVLPLTSLPTDAHRLPFGKAVSVKTTNPKELQSKSYLEKL